MKPTKYLIILGTILIGVGLISSLTYDKLHKHTTPPPNWPIYCDGNGHYATSYPNENYIIDEDHFNNPLTTRQQAVDRAWLQYEYELRKSKEEANRKPKPIIQWHICPTNK